MRLTSAHVVSYKSITDSGTFRIDPKVTALVGKNEAGKSAVLEAMYRLKPMPSGHPTDFEELRDYPRRYRARDRDKIPTTTPITMTFALEDSDKATVAANFGDDVLPGTDAVLTRAYEETTRSWTVKIDKVAIVRHAITQAGLRPGGRGR